MRVRSLAIVALGCLWLLPATASANHVQCGAVLTQDTVLDSDVVCTAQDPVGLVIGGDDFTLWLKGYTIRGAGAAGTDGIADDGTARSGVTIRRGTITGFEDGVDLDVSDSQILKVGVDATGVGLATRGNGNYIYRSAVDMSVGMGFSAIEALGDDSHIWGNHVTGSPGTSPDDGIVVHGDRPRVLVNVVDGCIFDGVILSSYTDGLVALNNVTNCDIGITPSGTGILLQRNITSGNCLGMLVDDPAALVRGNRADNNCYEGIVMNQDGATLVKNTANNNGEIGIEAPDDTIDGGGNTATGNPLADCLGVVCLPPLP